MDKYEIHLMGSMNLFAKDEDHALQIAEEQIKVTHPKFNIEVSNVKGNNKCETNKLILKQVTIKSSAINKGSI